MWWRLAMPCPPELEESLLWKLNELGLHRHALQHAPAAPAQKTLLLWLPQQDWPEAQCRELAASLEPLAEPFGINPPAWSLESVADEDWSLTWKQHWQPDPVGSHLLILPAWLEPPPEYQDRLIIRMDPGSAFGTGSHPTTRLCLEALERKPPRGSVVADLGCGSGVLGLAALRLGADSVMAVDADSLAVRATAANLELNQLDAARLNVALGSLDTLQDLLKGKRADLLLCNILAPVIEALAPGFVHLLAEDGRALLSGLLVDQAPRLQEVLTELGWTVTAESIQGRWELMEIHRT